MTSPETAAEVFDALGTDYETAFPDQTGQKAVLEWLLGRLSPGATVVDLGSGTGRPVAETLAAAGHDITGYDISAKMIEIARARVPAARFEQADLRALTRPAGSLDAVTAFFSLLQMTRGELDAVLAKVATWLVPGGHFVLGTVAADADEVESSFLGHPIRASSYLPGKFVARLEGAGLEIVYRELVRYESSHPGVRPEEQLYLTARRPG
ncbi:class I SAM-dependent DNA methyltransferase [Amycolatopsis tolypomycina]|uniref:Methyltransferase domain-containing protein n=1 Tax=Amycolatopsis tolypomycina TaxID=208445 RepID=A0A1H5AXM6_9PSEU|nr:methyltransferase domain-containing protein [Amycolatopsis tolypomycina]SED46534.1 Methyltransferase domain-containing protein [Amycolatopsis tolypomycina]